MLKTGRWKGDKEDLWTIRYARQEKGEGFFFFSRAIFVGGGIKVVVVPDGPPSNSAGLPIDCH